MENILIIDELGNSGIEILANDLNVVYKTLDGKKPLDSEINLELFDAIITSSNVVIDAPVLAAAKNLRAIGCTGIRTRKIDVDAATRQGVMVINTPQANAVSAAEHTMALMLAACRRIPQAHNAMKAGNHDTKPWQGIDLSGKTLGIVGLGAIGRLVALRAQAFGMTVMAVDPYISELVGRELGVILVDTDDLLEESDVISLHSTVTEETLQIINTESLKQIKDGTVLINITSARLIDPLAVADALKSGKLAGAAFDGSFEDVVDGDPFADSPNVVQTPSLATRSEEAIAAVSAEIVTNVLAALRGTAYQNMINLAWPTGADVSTVQPYIDLAETIGRLQSQLAPGNIERVEVEVSGEDMRPMVRPMAAGLLTGLLEQDHPNVNRVNAPYLAKDSGVRITQEYGIEEADYSNLITCRVHWVDENGKAGSRVVAGVLFGGREPRIVQVDEFRIEAMPQGTILVLRNKDVPGVIGQVATLLATYQVNIAEWRLGRSGPGEEALAFINLDGEPPEAVVAALEQAPAVTMAQLVRL
ncbi:MAG: phosphoglycerate dehydrogenase [Anaerolineae bacterium]